ncbi:cell adhesion molecule Dscam2-like [Sycon ciliatum]|uniref:cell adhesion molecule Dscam2-like n=1 Tax=Sycon ciliatum TaxID=27933 RepID=UPI0031F6F40F
MAQTAKAPPHMSEYTNGQHFSQHIFSVLILLGMLLAVQSQHENCKDGWVELTNDQFGHSPYHGPRDLYILPNRPSASLPTLTCRIVCGTIRSTGPIDPPLSTAFWYFNNAPVQDNPLFRIERYYEDRRQTSLNKDLIYTRQMHWPTTITQSMIGAYECSFRHQGVLSQRNIITLHVANVPYITFSSGSMTIVSTSWQVGSIALVCRANGTGPLNMTWTKNGRILPAYNGANGWTRKLGDYLTVDDSGMYTCTVSSPFGIALKQLTILVQDIPRFLIAPRPARIVQNSLRATSVALNLQSPSYKGNLPVKSYKVICKPDAEYRSYVKDTVQSFPLNTVTIIGLQPATKYTCWYHAENAAGSSGPSPRLRLETPESRSAAPQGLTAVSTSPGHATISFKPMPPALSHGTIIGYEITYDAVGCSKVEDCQCQLYNCSLHGSIRVHESWVSNSISLSGLRHFTRYQITAAAINGVGLGVKARRWLVTQKLAPGPVRNLTAIPISSSVLQARWQAPETTYGGNLYYVIQYSVLRGDTEERVSNDINIAMPQYTITGLKERRSVLITVFAVNSVGPGHRVTVGTITAAARVQPDVTDKPTRYQPIPPAFCKLPSKLGWIMAVASTFTPEIINLIKLNFSANTSLNLTCREGLYVSGNWSQRHQLITCQKSGMWTKEISACSAPVDTAVGHGYSQCSSDISVAVSIVRGILFAASVALNLIFFFKVYNKQYINDKRISMQRRLLIATA